MGWIAFGLAAFIVLLGFAFGSGGLRAGGAVLGAGILVALSPVLVLAAICAPFAIGVGLYEIGGIAGVVVGFLLILFGIPFAIGYRKKHHSPTERRERRAEANRRADRFAPHSRADAIRAAPDMRRAYYVRVAGKPDSATRAAWAALRSNLAPLSPVHPLASELAALKASLDCLDLDDEQAVIQATHAVEALAARMGAMLPHDALTRQKEKRRPEKRHYEGGLACNP
jgi:hypothetical protein